MVITLFRHGLTEGNKRRAYMGWNDSPLSEEAVTQLTAIKLEPSHYDYFISSDLNRCLATMKLLFPEVSPEKYTEFRELHFGDFQEKTYEDLKKDKAYQLWLKDSFQYSPPNGESFGQFVERIDKGWDRLVRQILANHIRNPFIVTHGGVIKYILQQYAPNEKDFWDWHVTHGNGYELSFQLDQLRRGERCISLREVPSMENENG